MGSDSRRASLGVRGCRRKRIATRARTARRWGILLSILPAAGCSSGPTESDGPSPAAGNWSYQGIQIFPDSREIQGTAVWFTVPGENGPFEGSYNLVEEQSGGGEMRSLVGVGSGNVFADTIADFELDLAGIRRRHVGILRNDSIVGEWVEIRSGGASGTFLLRRIL